MELKILQTVGTLGFKGLAVGGLVGVVGHLKKIK